ncbi:hypothetical protein DW939_07505 [Phocaeicola plebeius]|jgi:hypothetical protein|uniref:hypothetical protein n=1 Tax=Phocaeicola plebeius TaxID=310297 RepID=UPI000E525582|nr:hypothetical protein [Phocaeicola plebeius]RHA29850.1 hypothetical protein DW941_08535 [Phocaeicola plebeius]RHA34875.1 hypothetical protein DW939_07505 [Phocaeicola plebeius]
MEPIPIENELKAFKEHLDINERTIFSAKFGDGKTFFLNEFKKEYSDENKKKVDKKEKYYFITLYPVNYSVAENQDIFEYIKRDILLQLAIDEKLNPVDFDAIATSIFTWENLKEVICFLISSLPEGKILKKILEKGEIFIQKYKEKQTTFQKYESWFTSQKGGLYEHDGYTELIIETLKYIKSSGYKTVLIIEDLDRIDPAHLFRILNVLGAHIDEHIYKDSENTNKFGFDNIITVFDYNTTENIFHHFYGKDANYKGYINKFTSHQPFYYSIDEVAREYLYNFISEKCCITKESVRNSEQINNKFDSLSVRDVNTILNGIDLYIQEDVYKDGHLKFNTKSPLTYMISILKLLGIAQEEIKKTLLELPAIDLLNCINVFLYVDIIGVFQFRHNLFTTDRGNIPDNQIINKIKITKLHVGHTYIELNNEKIDKCIDKAFNYIRK